MATGAASDALLWGLYEGCISGCDTGIERRPYHRNCKCALHKPRATAGTGTGTTTAAGFPPPAARGTHNISYRIRRSWSEGSLALAASRSCSPSSSPVIVAIEPGRPQFGFCNEDDEEEEKVFGKF